MKRSAYRRRETEQQLQAKEALAVEEAREVGRLRQLLIDYLEEHPRDQQRLADAIGVVPSTITAIKQGAVKSVTLAKLRRAALAMNMPLHEVLAPAIVGPEQLVPPGLASTLNQAARLLEEYQHLQLAASNAVSDEGREIVGADQARVSEMLSRLFEPRLPPTEEQLLREVEGLSVDGLAVLIAAARGMKEAQLPVEAGRPDPAAVRCLSCRRGQLTNEALLDGVCVSCRETRASSLRLRYEEKVAEYATARAQSGDTEGEKV
jgi:transcriptional regulator with XRE-family HTH domain